MPKCSIELIEAEWRMYIYIYICVVNLTIIVSDNGLSPGRHQAIIWTIAGILLIEYLGTKFSDILIEIHTFSLRKMQFVKRWPFCLGISMLSGICVLVLPIILMYWVIPLLYNSTTQALLFIQNQVYCRTLSEPQNSFEYLDEIWPN